MSSEISKLMKSSWDKWWIKLHQKTSHRTRIRILANIFSDILSKDTSTGLTCLDVGCGDMRIAEMISETNPNTTWSCLDIYPLPDALKSEPKWKKYHDFDGKHIPFDDQAFDYVLLCDVLHHSLDPAILLRECARVGRKIIVKDHYQYGFTSNLLLKWMDRFGNQAYGVHIPGHYFSIESFSSLCKVVGLTCIKQQTGIHLYNHLPLIKNILRPKWQFWAVLEKK